MGKDSLRLDKSVGKFKIVLLGFFTPICLFQLISALIWLFNQAREINVAGILLLIATAVVIFASDVIWVGTFTGSKVKETICNPLVIVASVYLLTLPIVWQAPVCSPMSCCSFIGGMIVVDGIMLLISERKDLRFFRALIILGGVAICIVVSVADLAHDTNLLLTPEGILVNQTVVPNKKSDFPKYPAEVQSIWKNETDVYYEKTSDFYNALDEYSKINGRKATRDKIKIMVGTGLEHHGKDIAKHYIKDVGLNAFNTLGLSVYMHTNGRTKYGYNFFNFWQNVPQLSVKYMHISMWMCSALSIIGNVALVIKGIKRKEFKKICKLIIPVLIYMGLHTAVLTFINVPGADYNIGLLSTAVWLILPFIYLSKKEN